MHGSEPLCDYNGKTIDYCSCDEYEKVRENERALVLSEAIAVVESFMSDPHSGEVGEIDFILMDVQDKLGEMLDFALSRKIGIATCPVREADLCKCDPNCAWDVNVLARCECPEGEGHRK